MHKNSTLMLSRNPIKATKQAGTTTIMGIGMRSLRPTMNTTRLLERNLMNQITRLLMDHHHRRRRSWKQVDLYPERGSVY